MLFTAALGVAQVRIYVANSGDSRVSVIDPETNKIIGRDPRVTRILSDWLLRPKGIGCTSRAGHEGVLDAVDLKTVRRVRGVATGREPSGPRRGAGYASCVRVYRAIARRHGYSFSGTRQKHF